MKPHGLVYDKGFPDPGYYVRVPFGLFKEALQPQLRAPEHLTPAHLVDCLIQVYRIYRPLALDRLALVERNDPRDARYFQVLTSEQAQALGLHLEPKRPPEALPPNAMPVAQPGQHLWTIFVLFDPTRVQAKGRPQDAAARETAPDQAEAPELTPDD